MSRATQRQITKQRRAMRVRQQLRGCAQRPRLCIVKTLRHLQLQIIDDEVGMTLCGLNTESKEFRGTAHGKRGVESGRVLGEKLANKAKEQGIQRLVLDRGSSKYHGVIAAVAEAMREAGIQV